jgi:hypothetical protein
MKSDDLEKMLRPYARGLADAVRGQRRQLEVFFENRRHLRGSDARLLLWIWVGVCAVAFLSTIGTPPSVTVLGHYLALMTAFGVAGGLLSWHASRRWLSFKRAFVGAAFVAPVVAAIVWAQFDLDEESGQRTSGARKTRIGSMAWTPDTGGAAS